MPAPKLGGYAHREISAWMAVFESDDIDAIQEAIELIFTEEPKEAAKLLREVAKHMKMRVRTNTLLQANDVDEAREIFNNEILPALKAENKGN